MQLNYIGNAPITEASISSHTKCRVHKSFLQVVAWLCGAL